MAQPDPHKLALGLSRNQALALKYLVAKTKDGSTLHNYTLHKTTADSLLNRGLANCTRNDQGEYVLWCTDLGQATANYINDLGGVIARTMATEPEA